MGDRLCVVYQGHLVGWLEESPSSVGNGFGFRYAEEWLASPSAFGISLSLPLQAEPAHPRTAAAFFANLLPEGDLRRLVSARLGLSEDNDFALLKAIGGECAGALSILPEDGSAGDDRDYRPLTSRELDDIAKTSRALPEYAGQAGVRLSLAGAQDKLPVLVKGKRLYLPRGNAPSSHILKVGNQAFAHLSMNEYLATRVAQKLGLPVVEVSIWKQARHRLCLVRRYDRVLDHARKLVRLHQEDFCQALGVDGRRKYEAEGGPGFAACFGLVNRASQQPLADSEALLRWLIFGVLFGNADGHAKNLSFLYHPQDGIRLAPFYDLVCTRAYRLLDRALAMRIGESSDPGQIRGEDWNRTAETIGVGQRYLTGLVEQMTEEVPRVLDETAREFRKEHGDSPAIQMIQPVVRRLSRRVREQLKG